tara:strand:- start:32249 stop:35008 length:2760 start_codon:yes stop_codon:yes gene_type:complete
MIRKLAIALSLLGVCFTGLVHALGLGEVTIKSALNQPLNAKIELVNTAGLTINEILPGLATREEFQKANVDRVYFLSDLRFEVITNPQGKAHIVLTSKKPVREPFLNFIVELIWPSGRLLREYALLIDPPLFSNQPKVNVNAPKVAAQQSGDVLTMNAASGSAARSILAPVDKIESGSYGPTDSNDTLWDIAIKARPNRSVSPQQVMLAIQALNPNAFINDNINKLKAGQVLRLPTIDQIKERSQHQAIQLVIAQNEANAGKRSPSVAQGSKTASTSASGSASKPHISGDELKLVVSNDTDSNSSNSANSGQSNQSGSGVDNKLAVTLEKLDKAGIENKELNGRVSDLEEQLSTLQRLLTLKNDQLASIQSQMRSNELEKLQAGSNPVVSGDVNSELADAEVEAESALVGSHDDQLMADQTSAIIDESGQENKVATLAAETDSTNDQVSESLAPVVQAKDTNGALTTQKQASSDSTSQNLIQIIISNPLYLTISIISVLVLVFVLWLVSRHNAKREEEFQSQNGFTSDNNIFDENEADGFDEVSEDDSLTSNDGYEESEQDLSDYEDDFSEELDEESQDVLAEAEAYISYGRLDQAVQILEQAISQDPVRTDYRLKLLAVYKDLGDRQAFDRQFSELEAIQDGAAMLAAEKIRQDLIEEESLAFEADDTLLSSHDIRDKEAQDKENQDNKVVETEDLATELDQLNDEENKTFDFDSVNLEDESIEQEIDLSSELDLDSLNEETLSADHDLAEQLDESVEMDDILSLDSDAIEIDAALEPVSESEDFDDSILDVDLEDLDLNAELDQESEIDLDASRAVQEAAVQTAASGEELLVSDDVLEEATQAFEDGDGTQLDDDLADSDEFDFLNGTDESSTKLDLARAYIDMGDIDGAKDILLEVTKEGNEAQQAEAKELIDSID